MAISIEQKVVIGAGSIGLAVARRVGAGKVVPGRTCRNTGRGRQRGGVGSEGAFITGSDFLMDGGVTASWFYGELAPK